MKGSFLTTKRKDFESSDSKHVTEDFDTMLRFGVAKRTDIP
jgi:hypothetical protein